MSMTAYLVNPERREKVAKKRKTPPRGRNGQFRKRKRGGRRRKRRRTTTTAPARRRRRSPAKTAPTRRRRRRPRKRNPEMGLAGVGALMVAAIGGGFLIHTLDEKALNHPSISRFLPAWMGMGRFGRSATLGVVAMAIGGALWFFGRKGRWLKLVGAGIAVGGTVAAASGFIRRRLIAGSAPFASELPAPGANTQLGAMNTQATYDAAYDRGYQAALEQAELSGLVEAGGGVYGNPEMTPGFGGLVEAGGGVYGAAEDFEAGYGMAEEMMEADWADGDGWTEADLVEIAYGDDYGDPLMDSSILTAQEL